MQNPASAIRPRAALVTGGAKRIGRAITLALAGAGYAVAIRSGRRTISPIWHE
jgi:NAD(P)-dependent dehydrogenase (short-subunit alcohol dehydrogenase family)